MGSERPLTPEERERAITQAWNEYSQICELAHEDGAIDPLGAMRAGFDAALSFVHQRAGEGEPGGELVDHVAKAIMDSDDYDEGERWDDFEDDAPARQEYRENARAAIAALDAAHQPKGER